MSFWHTRRVMVTGGSGFLGNPVKCGQGMHVVNTLQRHGAHEVSVADRDHYDLRQLTDIRRALNDIRPHLIIHLAARVGGIPLRVATGRLRTRCEPRASG